jgi:hypothetical protein
MTAGEAAILGALVAGIVAPFGYVVVEEWATHDVTVEQALDLSQARMQDTFEALGEKLYRR